MWPWCQVTQMTPSLCIESWWPRLVTTSRLCSQVGWLVKLCTPLKQSGKMHAYIFLFLRWNSVLLICVFPRRNRFKRNIHPVRVVVGGAFETWEMCVPFSHFCPLLFHHFSFPDTHPNALPETLGPTKTIFNPSKDVKWQENILEALALYTTSISIERLLFKSSLLTVKYAEVWLWHECLHRIKLFPDLIASN